MFICGILLAFFSCTICPGHFLPFLPILMTQIKICGDRERKKQKSHYLHSTAEGLQRIPGFSVIVNHVGFSENPKMQVMICHLAASFTFKEVSDKNPCANI